ncbi:ethanolamine ammonia-lyase reactivating factor EutA [Clostridium autoethanogenum]|uniref:Ethanolamine ammonia-lyase reactivating factor EutA n=1 Tax=Clostridium autoethanogenum TaxID=84023 RepID=A0A3M0SUA2_9CLOT|nr:ethanolamine ammonia-lyase reactivating factor EutA [Clostridium autoethanogenum]RMD02083.1 ethanolamine ammonia-lyase reactivating factor EutA [Clostridium autoethanogenum]
MKQEILSVGIDIGTSTTQLVFSRITIENMASSFSIPKINIVDKKVIYKSNIYFTPLVSQNEIDGSLVRKIVESEYKKAGIKPEEVETGAIIITGETARKENAREILDEMSGLAGDFVVATAGPDLESIIAGKGAGTNIISKEENCTAANMDIGGGTTNLAVFKEGEVIDTGCLDIGGRLIKIDKNTHEITYIASKIKKLADKYGINIKVGEIPDISDVENIVKKMVELLEQSVGMKNQTHEYEEIITNKGLKLNYNIDCITFSGGVANYIYAGGDEEDVYKYGDIGVLLGRCIKNSTLTQKFNLEKSRETIRATVVGAGSHTTDISGSTITYTKNVFPIKNIPVVRVHQRNNSIDCSYISETLKERLHWFKVENEFQQVAIAIDGTKSPSFKEVQQMASSVISGVSDILDEEYPLFVIVENDMGKVLGQTIYKMLDYKKDVICIDSIKVEAGDYVDVGKPLMHGRVVPVVIKTLAFSS